MKRTSKHHFRDILDYAESSVQFIKNMNYEEFANDKKTVFAVVRALEVVGEASNRVPEEIKEKYSYLPWNEMRGLRNKIVHSYDDIDYVIVWNVVQNEIPKLISQIKLIIDEIC